MKETLEPVLPAIAETDKELDKIDVTIDQEKIDSLAARLDEKKKEMYSKLYPVKMDLSTFKHYKSFFKSSCEWVGKQALGVAEILNRIEAIETEGITDNTINLTNLQIEASHYFLNSHKGVGGYDARRHLSIIKPIEDALQLLQPDNKAYKDLEMELTAAKQGLNLE